MGDAVSRHFSQMSALRPAVAAVTKVVDAKYAVRPIGRRQASRRSRRSYTVVHIRHTGVMEHTIYHSYPTYHRVVTNHLLPNYIIYCTWLDHICCHTSRQRLQYQYVTHHVVRTSTMSHVITNIIYYTVSARRQRCYGHSRNGPPACSSVQRRVVRRQPSSMPPSSPFCFFFFFFFFFSKHGKGHADKKKLSKEDEE